VKPKAAVRQHVFPCQQCGAQLEFQPGTNELSCTHCGHNHQIRISGNPIHEYNYHSTLHHLPQGAEDTIVITVDCKSCSAEFEFNADIHADECPFCGSQIVVNTGEHKIIQPESLLPFNITSRQAQDHYKDWLKRLWFAPNKLKKYARKERKLRGMYVPYWTYDCYTKTHYRGQRGDTYTEPKRTSVIIDGKRKIQTRMVTKIRWRNVNGEVERDFDDVLVYATNSLPRSMARELAPWDLWKLTPYQDEFLSGFQSEIYKINLDQGFEIAKERMHSTISQDIRLDIGGDHQRINATHTEYSKITFKHILLPFWIAGFRFRNKTYQFIVNGRTGEVQGDRPYSWIKIGLAVLAVITVAIIFMNVAMESGFNEIGLNLLFELL